jgi:alpha-tubulin suppressor-like RCC1 family protein
MNRLIPTLCVTGIVLILADTGQAFWSDGDSADHQMITKAALSPPNTFSFAGVPYSFSATAIDTINATHLQADNPLAYLAVNHFDSTLIPGSLAQMSSNRRDLNTLLANAVSATPADTAAAQPKIWTLLGYMLHAAEDFYAHSSWIDMGNIGTVGFGTLTESYPPIIPPSLEPVAGNLCPAAGYPLFQPVTALTTGFYPPAVAPAGECIHGSLPGISFSCVLTPLGPNAPSVVLGISHDIPCASAKSTNNQLHVIAKFVATQEAQALVQSIVSDLNTKHNAAGFCALLGLDTRAPACDTFSIGVTASGLLPGASVVLQNNGGDNLTVSANATLTSFPTPLAAGATYSVTVLTQPAQQTCSVSNGSGTVTNANITNIVVSCSNEVYSIGVTVTGLAQGASVVLQDNGDDDLTVASNGTFTFATPIANGVSYAVSVQKQPTNQTCSVSNGNGSGIVAGASVNVPVTCTTNTVSPSSAMVSAGEVNTCALSSSGLVYCWGYNNDGEIGNGTHGSTLVTAPAQVTGLSGIVGISVGWYHACAVGGNNGAWCWGQDNSGDLGYGNRNLTPFVPVAVVGPSGTSPLSGVAAVAAGEAFSCARMQGGSVMCWGTNAQGQLGDNIKESAATAPVPVSNLSGVKAIAAGATHACALTTAGAVLCWGDDTFGEIGDGNYNTISPLPSTVPGLPTDIVGITAGYHSTCAIEGSGAIWCWGYDLYGELGVGPPAIKYLTPTPVASLANGATAVATFAYHSCAQIGGGMQCWGNEGLGLGTSVSDNSSTPAFVLNPFGTGPLSGVAQMSVGDGFTCALLSSGGVDCWGANNAGQLGNGVIVPGGTTTSTLPTPVLGVGGSGFLQL